MYDPAVNRAGNARTSSAVATGSFVERLICHPRLPLVAGLDAARSTVHVWEVGGDGLRALGVVDADGAAYPPEPWERYGLIPAVAWHPAEPILVVAGGAALHRWTPEGVSPLVGLPAKATCRSIAFSPDGRTLWISPQVFDENTVWLEPDRSAPTPAALYATGLWDTGVATHPGGGVVVTLCSDQGATDVLFVRPGDGVPAPMHVLQHALTLDVDGYETPVFSADGGHLAIRGNAYAHTLDVFEFPSLRQVLHTTLGEPPSDWAAEPDLWSRHNIAFAAGSGALLVGTPQGSILEFDLDGEQVTEHRLSEAPISAIAVMSTGELVVADRSGRSAVVHTPGDLRRNSRSGDGATARARVEEFLAATTELPSDVDLYDSLVRTDGYQVWGPEDLDEVTAATEDDPLWLQRQAAINAILRERS